MFVYCPLFIFRLLLERMLACSIDACAVCRGNDVTFNCLFIIGKSGRLLDVELQKP